MIRIAFPLLLVSVATAAVAAEAKAPVAVSAPVTTFGPTKITRALDGSSDAFLATDGYQLVRGTVVSVSHPDAKRTVVKVQPREGRARTVRFTHPAKFSIPVEPKQTVEIEVGARKSGFTSTIVPYVSVSDDFGKPLLLCNAQDTSGAVSVRAGQRAGDVDKTKYLLSAVFRISGQKAVVPADAWFELDTGDSKWLAWHHHESIRPDAAPGTRNTVNEFCLVRAQAAAPKL